MVSINTNLQSLLLQQNLKRATTNMNTAIERLTTGVKINSASDNAANYSIANIIDSKISSLEVASDNVAMGLDLADTASDTLDLVTTHLNRIRDLLEQSANGTYGAQSRNAIQSEVDARLSEINRIIDNCDYDGIKLFTSGLLPSSAQVKLADFGMSAGTIGVNLDGHDYTISLNSDDTLYSLMTKMETLGLESEFNEETGVFTARFNADDITDNGTHFKEILGITNTDGYATSELEEDVEKTSINIAELTTQLKSVGVTSGSFTIVNSDGTETNDSISITSTIQDLFNKLATYNITGSLSSEGVITLDTPTKYIKGDLANQLGIKYNETYTTDYTGRTANTTKSLTHEVVETATASTTMGTLGVNLGDTLVVNNNSGEVLHTITADNAFLNKSIGTVLNELVTSGYMTSANINNGVISLSSGVHNYITGTIATKFGIGVNTDGAGGTTTVAKAQTSSSAVTYSVTATADLTTTFTELNISASNPVTVYNSSGTQVGTVTMTQNSTLATFIGSINALTTAGNATLTNGVISIDSGYITGDIANAMGIGYEITSTTDNREGIEGTIVNSSTVSYVLTPILTGTVASSGTVATPSSIIAASTFTGFIESIAQVTSFSGPTYVRDGVTYTVAGTAADLQTALNNNENVILSSDIDLDGFDWEIVNGYSKSFDGNGHVISNLTLDVSVRHAGLFGSVSEGGTIANLGMDCSLITNNRDDSGMQYTGGIVGWGTNSNINNCYITNSTISLTSTGIALNATGGIVGYSDGIVNSCAAFNCSLSDQAYGAARGIGGIAGCALNISNSNVYDINISAIHSYAGGVTGICKTIINSNTFYSTINAEECSGGIAGYADTYNALINNCNVYNSELKVKSANNRACYCGGIVAKNNYSVINNSNVYQTEIQTYGYTSGTVYLGGTAGFLSCSDGNQITGCKVNATISSVSTVGAIGTIVGKASNLTCHQTTLLTSCTYASSMTQPRSVGTVTISNALTSEAWLSKIGVTEECYLTLHNSTTSTDEIVTVNPSMTLAQLTNTIYAASSHAISFGYNSSGTFKITQTSSSDYVVGMSDMLANALKFSVGQGNTYTGDIIYTYEADDSNTLNGNKLYSINNSTTLGQLGINSSKTFTTNGNNVVTIGVNDSIVSKLTGAGLGASISGGQLTISGDSSHILTSMDSALSTALKINVGESYTYTISGEVIHSNTNSHTQNINNVTTLSTSNSSSLSMADLGLTNSGTVTTNNYVISVNTTDLMSEVLQKFNNAGITASINDSNGTLTLTGSAENYIQSASNNIKSLLGLNTGNGYTYDSVTITTRTNSNSKSQSYINTYTVQETATGNTLLSKFDNNTYSTAGNLVFSTDDGFKTVSISSTDTINTFRDKLSEVGVTSSFSNGQLMICANNGTVSMMDYGPKTTSRIADLMGLNYDTTLDNYVMSNDLNALADEKYEETLDMPSSISIQVGINGNSQDAVSIDTSLALGRVNFDAMSAENSQKGLKKIDEILNTVTSKQQNYAALSNRLDSAAESIYTYIENLTKSRSTLIDTDVAVESSNYIKAQILQQSAATLLATANQSPGIALQLI